MALSMSQVFKHVRSALYGTMRFLSTAVMMGWAVGGVLGGGWRLAGRFRAAKARAGAAVAVRRNQHRCRGKGQGAGGAAECRVGGGVAAHLGFPRPSCDTVHVSCTQHAAGGRWHVARCAGGGRPRLATLHAPPRPPAVSLACDAFTTPSARYALRSSC